MLKLKKLIMPKGWRRDMGIVGFDLMCGSSKLYTMEFYPRKHNPYGRWKQAQTRRKTNAVMIRAAGLKGWRIEWHRFFTIKEVQEWLRNMHVKMETFDEVVKELGWEEVK